MGCEVPDQNVLGQNQMLNDFREKGETPSGTIKKVIPGSDG
jgi:hypothetical protein